MNGVNLQILIGNLGRNAEIRSIDGSRSKANFSLATNKTYKNREGQSITNTYWHNVVVWDPKLVEVAEKYCTTGQQVFVEGESTTRSYQDRQGNTQYIREIKATRLIPIEYIDQEQGDFSSVTKAFIAGRLAEKPLLTTNDMGEASCTLVFKYKEDTLPIEMTGPKAEIAARYLDQGRVAHVHYEIVSIHPFKAVGLDLTLLGQRPNDQAESSPYQNREKSTSVGNVIAEDEGDSELDDLPF